MTAVERGDYEHAIDSSHGITFPSDWLPSRIGHLHLDLARAHLWSGDPHQAVSHLQQARSIAPQQAQKHPSAQKTIESIIHGNRPSAAALAYADWMSRASTGNRK